MKNRNSITAFIQNYDHEFDNQIDWLEIHLFEMRNEVLKIERSIFLIGIIDKEWGNRVENNNYSLNRITLFESLIDKVIMGLSKILKGNREYSLLKTINVISQMDEFKNNSAVKKIANETQLFIENSELSNTVIMFRDKFFGHLDKECVISDLRLSPTLFVNEIQKFDLEDIKSTIIELYKVCFDKEIDFYSDQNFNEKDFLDTFFSL
ncbi:hypothetical protein [Enterococcus sp.]|uniref:hypothetical protein n=1 Tax=Enterococcus sp. TaxID=35783 RepID=UPI00290E41CF|nr:hypothetical protein [Enterococcus sp.]MDU5335811.1 hypothetical protein [Enterococcus sp.]